jgi:glucosyl-3-phosphoglycerate synthase
MISVIIPVVNQATSLSALVAFARFHAKVTQVIVVDDGSMEDIGDLADATGATVVTSNLFGRGCAMRDGLKAAKNELILYLDSDLRGMREDLIESMAEPLLTGQADFVKSRHSRMPGRALGLIVRSYFPELARIDQPLDGVLAARKELLEALPFEPDYGVNLGLLIDTALAGMQIVEVDVGDVEYDYQPLEKWGDMTAQVVRSLLARAFGYGRLAAVQRDDLYDACPQKEKDIPFLLEQAKKPHRIALIDMDRVLLQTPLLFQLVLRMQNCLELHKHAVSPTLSGEDDLSMMAAFCVGSSKELLEKIAQTLTLRAGARQFVSRLRCAGYRVGLISDSFHAITDIVRHRVSADFCIAHAMIFQDGIATGHIVSSPIMYHSDGCRLHALCRSNALLHLYERMESQPAQILAVGSGRADACMLRAAGQAIGFHPETIDVRDASDIVSCADLADLLPEIHGTSDY